MGVKHACVFSPQFFYLYSDTVDLESLAGFTIGGRNLNSVTYANNTVLMADPPPLQKTNKKKKKLKNLRGSALDESG